MNASPIDRADARLAGLRSSATGEALWLTFLGACVALHVAGVVAAFARPDLIDFAAFVDNARAWLDGSAYPGTSRDPNAPHTILLFVPFVSLSPWTGLAVWMVICYASLGLALRLLWRELALRVSTPLTLTALAVLAAAPPMLDIVVSGNMIWPFMAGFTLAWIWARSGRPGAAAALLGVLMTAKPFLGAFLLYYAIRQRWALLAIGAGAAAATLVAAVAITGTDAWMAWLNALQRITWGDVRNASLMGVLARLEWPRAIFWVVAATAVGAITAWHLRRTRADVDWDWALVLVASLLVAPLGWRYYFCFGLGPLVALWSRDVLSRRTRLAALLLVWSPSLVLPTTVAVVKATLGSLTFWTLLNAWIAVVTSGARSNASRRR